MFSPIKLLNVRDYRARQTTLCVLTQHIGMLSNPVNPSCFAPQNYDSCASLPNITTEFCIFARMKRILGILLMLSIISTAWPQQRNVMRCCWWNVENLFDTERDSLHDDRQFQPKGEYHWTATRYWHKLDNVARTIAALAHDDQWPAMVGICEVESPRVMNDLTQRSPLRAAGYRYVISNSPDVRGINVALLYHPDCMRLISSCGVRIPSKEHGIRPTRDILHASLLTTKGDTLHVICVHLPSRRSGKSGDIHRMLAAQTLLDVVDSLVGQRVIVMGDFNAEPDDKIFQQLTPQLISLIPQKRSEQYKLGGTYYFQDRWSILDHILVSPTLLPCCTEGMRIGKFPHLLTEEGAPWRTYRGPIYQGGYSDHLPVWVDISLP